MSHEELSTPDCRVEIWNESTREFALCEMHFNNATQNYLLIWQVESEFSEELRTIELSEDEMLKGHFNQAAKRLRLDHIYLRNDVFVQKASFPGSN